VVLALSVLLIDYTGEAYELVKCHTTDDCKDLSDFYTCEKNPKDPEDD